MIKQRGRAGYQEALLDRFVKDIWDYVKPVSI
jgi:hypothetical protein